jgi:hypothetical protein
MAEPPTDEQLMQEFQEELKRLKVEDLLVQTLYTVSSLGYHKLGSENRDLEQARLAIDALQALLPVVKDEVQEEVARDFQQVVANMQLAYAAAVTERPKDEPPAPAGS